MTRTRSPEYWVPFRNPFSSLKELDDACHMTTASDWQKRGLMPFWVELILAGAAPGGIKGAVRQVNTYLSSHPQVEPIFQDRTLQLVERIA